MAPFLRAFLRTLLSPVSAGFSWLSVLSLPVLLVSGTVSGSAQTLAFPGAEGFGRFASGGRGGNVYIVTNLNDSGPGSLRDAVTNRSASSPRTVVFAVSGTIYLNSTLRISQGNLTIAGQTAPGDGICLARYSLNPSNASNVIIRFLRSRLGDTMLVEDDAFICRYATNVIVDHCSFSWSVDETASAYDNTDFTMQWCFVTESLRDSVHSKGAHGYGGIWGGLGASFHHNLLAHHDSRNPRFNGARTHGTGGELVDMRNNVVYNWRGNSTYGGEPTDAGLPSRQAVVNNHYKNGPATGTGAIRYRIIEPSENTASTGATFGLFHVAGNQTTASPTVSADNWAGGVQAVTAAEIAQLRSHDPFAVAPVFIQSASAAAPLVIAYGGCRLPARDSVDARIAGEVANGSFTYRGSKGNYAGIIDSQADVGGWPVLDSATAPADADSDGMPDAWELAHGLDPNLASDRNLVDPATGYTRLELYLNELAAPAFPRPSISVQPQSRSVGTAAGFTLSVTAAAPAETGALAYQWYRDGAPVEGATAASLTVDAASAADAGDYHVVVTNNYGSVGSSIAAVSILDQPPSIVGQPASQSVAAGQDVVFSVNASGSPPFTYQWYRGADPVPGADSATLEIEDVTPAHAGSYHVVVGNPYGSIPSETAVLSVTTQTSGRVFSTDFTRDTIHAASPVVDATRGNWYVMASKLATNSNVGDDPATSDVVEARPFTLALNSGSSAANYQAATVFTPTPLSLAQTGSSVRVTATLRTNNNINLGVGLFNSGGSLPHTIHHSGTTTLLGGADGIDGGVRHWVGYRALLTHGSAAASFVTRPAQTTSEGSITNRTQDLVVPGSGSTSYGQPAGTSVGDLVNSSTAVTPANGATYTLVFQIARVASDRFTLVYELYSGSAVAGAPLFSASGNTTAAGALPSAVTSSFDGFAIGARTTNGVVPGIVLDALHVDYTAPVANTPPVIAEHPSSIGVLRGGSASFTVQASGDPAPSYQWRKDTEDIPGATSATFSISPVQPSDAGSYACFVSNASGSALSDAATLTVHTPLAAWALDHGLDPDGDGAPDANPSGDGVPNLLKFALGGDPTVAGSAVLPSLARVGDGLLFVYDVKIGALSDYEVGAERSADLVVWTPAVHGADGVVVSSSALDPETERVTVAIPAAPGKTFARVRVSAK